MYQTTIRPVTRQFVLFCLWLCPFKSTSVFSNILTILRNPARELWSQPLMESCSHGDVYGFDLGVVKITTPSAIRSIECRAGEPHPVKQSSTGTWLEGHWVPRFFTQDGLLSCSLWCAKFLPDLDGDKLHRRRSGFLPLAMIEFVVMNHSNRGSWCRPEKMSAAYKQRYEISLTWIRRFMVFSLPFQGSPAISYWLIG